MVSVNAAGDVTRHRQQTAPANGDDLVTSLNAQIQGDAQNALDGAIARSQASGQHAANQGAAVVMTTTGRVVAMASYPDYNPSVWTGGISQRQFRDAVRQVRTGEPIINRTTQGQYAPGSTFKVTSTAAAVAARVLRCTACTAARARSPSPATPSATTASRASATMTLTRRWSMSCDTVFYKLGYHMYLHDKPEANVQASRRTPRCRRCRRWSWPGASAKTTGIDLPEESTGTIPTRQWLYYLWKDNAHTGQNWCKYGKQYGSYVQQIEYEDCQSGYVWEPGQAAIAAIGQGYVTVTPLQLANAYAALANGGTLYSPRIGKALLRRPPARWSSGSSRR